MIEEYLFECRARNLNSKTIQAYRNILTRTQNYVGVPLEAATREQLYEYLGEIGEYRTSNTHSLYGGTLQQFFSWLEDRGVRSPSPLNGFVSKKRNRDPDVPTLTSDDVRKLLDGCLNPKDEIAISLMAYTGARSVAVSRLRWEDVDFERATARFHEKGDRIIVRPLPPPLVDLLAKHRGSGSVLRLSTNAIYQHVKTVGERVGLPHASPHRIRSAFADRFLELNGERIITLKELMGHESIQTTEGYVRRYNRRLAMEEVRGLTY